MSEDRGRSNKTTARVAFLRDPTGSKETHRKGRQIDRRIDKRINEDANDRWLQRLLGR